MEYQRKPTKVDAMQWRGDGMYEVYYSYEFTDWVKTKDPSAKVEVKNGDVFIDSDTITAGLEIGNWLVWIDEDSKSSRRIKIYSDDDFNNRYKECDQ